MLLMKHCALPYVQSDSPTHSVPIHSHHSRLIRALDPRVRRLNFRQRRAKLRLHDRHHRSTRVKRHFGPHRHHPGIHRHLIIHLKAIRSAQVSPHLIPSTTTVKTHSVPLISQTLRTLIRYESFLPVLHYHNSITPLILSIIN